MPLRYSDSNTLAGSAADFIIRRRTPTLLQLLLILITTFVIAISVILTAADKLALVIILIILLSAVGSYVAVQLQRSRDLVLTTEFQNALFASALGINNKFCLIIRMDGNIVYLDRSFQEMFPDFIKQPRRTVSVLLNYGKLSPEESKKIFAAIERNVYDKVIFTIRDSKGEFHKIVMSIEPILRPEGFILLRGREYIDERSSIKIDDLTTPNSPLTKSTIALFSYVMDTMDMGVYMTDPSGNIIYANPVLEQWLGYKEGEVTSRSLSLQDIIRHNGTRTETINPGDYEGVAMLQKKTGGLMHSFVNQKIIRNDRKKVIGCTALVHNIIEQGTEEKKKLW